MKNITHNVTVGDKGLTVKHAQLFTNKFKTGVGLGF
jgi:hypothetical protein